jgi:hypothetical protein
MNTNAQGRRIGFSTPKWAGLKDATKKEKQHVRGQVVPPFFGAYDLWSLEFDQVEKTKLIYGGELQN